MSDRTRSTAGQEARARDDVTALLSVAEARRENFVKLLPSYVSWETFKDTFKLAIQANPRLLAANRDSLWVALQKAAIDGLMPDGREGALVIFNEEVDEDGNPVSSGGSREKNVVWMPMYQGLLKLARNTGEVTTVRARLIYEGESFTMTDIDGVQSYKHERRLGPDFDDSDGKIVAAYAVINFKDGSWDMEPMSRRQIDRVRAVSRAKSPKAPWQQWYGQMALKTVLRQLLKRQPKQSVNRIEAALDRDETMTIEGTVEPPTQAVATRQPRTPEPRPSTVFQEEERGAPPQDVEEAQAPKPTRSTAPKPVPPKPEPKPEPPAFSHFATDEFGDPAETAEFTTPLAFARWFEEAAEKTTNIEALFENNGDPIADVGADQNAIRIITEALNAARARLTAPVAQDEPEEPESIPLPAEEDVGIPSRTPITPPMTPKGALHGPNFKGLAEAEIGALATAAECDEWERVNLATYQGHAIEAAVERLLREKRASVSTDHTRLQADKDTVWVDDQIATLATLNTKVALEGWANNAIVKTVGGRLQRERPELYERLAAAYRTQMAAVATRA